MNDYLSGLARMANQIGRNFATRSADEAVAGIAEHLERFWDPSMRSDLADAAAAGRVNVSAPVRKALQGLTPDQPFTPASPST